MRKAYNSSFLASMKFISTTLAALLIYSIAPHALAAEEVTLFDQYGYPVGYIDSGNLTIFLWNGEPVAYLRRDNDTRFSAFGYNGRHLGWYLNGVLYGHDGDAVCAIGERLNTTHDRDQHSRRQFVRIKAMTEAEPPIPVLYNSFSAAPCDDVLNEGASR